MAAASLRRTGMSLRAMRRDRGSKFICREVTVWIGALVSGGLTGIRGSAIPETFASVEEHVELDGIISQVDDE